jgi:transketolase
MTDLRDVFFYSLLERAKKDKDIVLLTADMGAFALRDFAQQLPYQFFNVGIAEQNMISVAAGLARKGKRVYCYAISSFLLLRAFEQLKIDVCNMKSCVILVGVGAGVDYSYDGSTHHCPNDIGVLRTLPNMSIYVPFDEETVRFSTGIAGPLYIRLPKGVVPSVSKTDIAPGYHILRDGKAFILTYGTLVHKMIKLLDELKAKDVGLLAVTKLKPMYDLLAFGPLARQGVEYMIVEQHSIHGGILSALGEDRLWQDIRGRYNGYNDVFVDIGGSSAYVEHEAGLDYKRIKRQITELQEPYGIL